ncbi:MAG: ABC transporter permease [Planctomycetota bacterium]
MSSRETRDPIPPDAGRPAETNRPAGSGDVQIRGASIRAGSRDLLVDADATFPSGKVSLLVGVSGAGKTVLTRFLGGLEPTPGLSWSGDVIVGSSPRGRERRVGIVYQNFALFDELSADGNITFACDHSPSKNATATGDLLDEFQVPKGVRVQALSGGQQQRLAIARTLAYDPPVVVYDEPTSGLDAANAKRVADRIRATCEKHGKTTIVVTHDYQNLGPIADEVFVLDPVKKSLRQLSPDELSNLEALKLPEAPREEVSTVGGGFSAGGLLRKFLELPRATGAALDAAVMTVLRLAPAWRSPRWGLRYLGHYLALVASPSAWIYFAFAGMIAGFVGTDFTFKFLPHKIFTEPLIIEELLRSLGSILYRTVVPILTTVLLAARSGAALASDVGTRRWGHQLDSMRSFGAPPGAYLLTGGLWAFGVMTPFLVGAAFLSARFTSLVVFSFTHPQNGPYFWDINFHTALRVADSWIYFGTWWLVAKSVVCGLGVATIAYHIGARPKTSGVDVSRGVTRTIIWATIFVLIVHLGFAFFEFEVKR